MFLPHHTDFPLSAAIQENQTIGKPTAGWAGMHGKEMGNFII